MSRKITSKAQTDAQAQATQSALALALAGGKADAATADADAQWRTSAIHCAQARALDVSAPVLAAGNAVACADVLDSVAPRWLYTSPESIGYHAETGRLFLIVERADAVAYEGSTSDAQTVVRTARDTMGADAVRTIIADGTSVVDVLAVLRKGTADARKVKAQADAARKAQAAKDAATAVLAEARKVLEAAGARVETDAAETVETASTPVEATDAPTVETVETVETVDTTDGDDIVSTVAGGAPSPASVALDADAPTVAPTVAPDMLLSLLERVAGLIDGGATISDASALILARLAGMVPAV